MLIIIDNFFPSVPKMLPSNQDLEERFTNFGSEIFSDDPNASHYLYVVRCSAGNCCTVRMTSTWPQGRAMEEFTSGRLLHPNFTPFSKIIGIPNDNLLKLSAHFLNKL